MPIYPGRRAGTWRVTIYAHGRQHEWTVEGKKREAESFEARQRIAFDAGRRPSTRVAPTLQGFCLDVYRPHAEKHLKESTWKKVRAYQIATLCSHLGRLKLTEIKLEAIEEYKRARNVKPSSVNNELRVLRTVLNYAEQLGYPVAKVAWKRLPTRGASRVHVWTATQIQALYEAARLHAPDFLPMLVFLANTGCRKGEAIACEWSWVDGEAGMLRIPSNDVWRPKSGKPREVPISKSLAAVLGAPRRHERWVFPSRDGGRYAEFPKDMFARVRGAAKLSGGPHSLRHSYASAFLAAVPDMFLLAQILGHSHTRISELYSHLLPGHLARAMNAVDMAPPGNSGGDSGDAKAELTLH